MSVYEAIFAVAAAYFCGFLTGWAWRPSKSEQSGQMPKQPFPSQPPSTDPNSEMAQLRRRVVARTPEELLDQLHGPVTVTRNEAGEIVAITRTDSEGRILFVIWERNP